MNNEERKLYAELEETSEEYYKLIELISEGALPSAELKDRYKNLKNSCKNRLREIKLMGKPINVNQGVYNRFYGNYREAMSSGFREPTNGNLSKMIYSLEEAAYKFKKFINEGF